MNYEGYDANDPAKDHAVHSINEDQLSRHGVQRCCIDAINARVARLEEALRLVEGLLHDGSRDNFGLDERCVPFTDEPTGNIGQVIRAALAGKE